MSAETLSNVSLSTPPPSFSSNLFENSNKTEFGRQEGVNLEDLGMSVEFRVLWDVLFTSIIFVAVVGNLIVLWIISGMAIKNFGLVSKLLFSGEFQILSAGKMTSTCRLSSSGRKMQKWLETFTLSAFRLQVFRHLKTPFLPSRKKRKPIELNHGYLTQISMSWIYFHDWKAGKKQHYMSFNLDCRYFITATLYPDDGIPIDTF